VKEVGFLLLNTCQDQEIFTQGNLRRLTYIASYVALALENDGLYQNIMNSKNYLQNIIESINQGILAMDTNGNFSLMNHNITALLGLKSADIIGQNYQHLLSPELKGCFDIIIGQTIKEGYVIDYRLDHTFGEGQNIPLAINSSLLRDEKGDPNGVIMTFRDLTTSLELQKFRELDSIKDEFVSNVCHELRTPLSIIKSYVETLLDRVKPKDISTQKEFLSIVNQACDRLIGVVNNLLDISRIQSGRFFLDLKQVNIKDIAISVIKALELSKGEVEIGLDLDQDLPRILADEEKIYQVILNVASNAIKYSPKGGTVLIKAFKDNDMVKLMIQDQGVGIPEDELPYIFDKFYRSSSSANEIQGSGLGLPIAKSFVEAHQGTIEAQSTLGRGSIFTITLPCTDRMEEGNYGRK
jgi:PAS domain S-box-containing protein